MLSPRQQSVDIRTDIIKSIVFLDLFSYPVSSYELWKFLDRKYSLIDILNILENLQKEQILAFKAGFYFLFGHNDLLIKRWARHNYTCYKLKIAQRFSRIFSIFPGIKLVAAANLIGGYNWRHESDIDIFIVTKNGQLWLSRLFCVGITKLLRSRPTKKTKKNKICLSFYVTLDALNLKDLELKDEDPYFNYWQKGLHILYNHMNTWIDFQKENKLFIYDQYQIEKNKDITSFFKNNLIVVFFEKLSKNFQLHIMAQDLRLALLEQKGVLITDNVLKLYLQDRRFEFLQKFKQKLHEVSQKNN